MWRHDTLTYWDHFIHVHLCSNDLQYPDKTGEKTKRASFDCAIYEAYQNILCHIKDVNPIKFRASGTEKGQIQREYFLHFNIDYLNLSYGIAPTLCVSV